MADLLNNTNSNANNYGDDAIVTLSPREHIRLRPGMYVGVVGDGSQPDEALYVLIKEVVDNSIDEFIMGAGRQIDITLADNVVTVRDYGRGIPPQVARGGRLGDEHRRQVRRLGLQEDRGPERRGRQGRQHAFRRVYGPLGPRRRGPHGDLRQGSRSERQVGERRQREERHVHLVPRRQGDFRRICLQPRIRRAENPQLQLPEPGSDAQFQRQELRFEKRSAGPRERQHDRGPALPAHPPHGRRTSRWRSPTARATARVISRS